MSLIPASQPETEVIATLDGPSRRFFGGTIRTFPSREGGLHGNRHPNRPVFGEWTPNDSRFGRVEPCRNNVWDDPFVALSLGISAKVFIPMLKGSSRGGLEFCSDARASVFSSRAFLVLYRARAQSAEADGARARHRRVVFDHKLEYEYEYRYEHEQEHEKALENMGWSSGRRENRSFKTSPRIPIHPSSIATLRRQSLHAQVFRAPEANPPPLPRQTKLEGVATLALTLSRSCAFDRCTSLPPNPKSASVATLDANPVPLDR